MMKRSHARRIKVRRGFTLIEILLVLAILVVVAGAVVLNTVGVQESAYKKIATTRVAALSQDVNKYRLLVGQLPTSLNDLFTAPSDVDASKWTQVLDKAVEPDPWGHPYDYKVNGTKFEIRSFGPDGQANTQDDIVS